MGKAYTEEERDQIRIRIMEEGVRLFHENGSQSLSIRELTARAGISLGGFYSFYPTKEALVLDIVRYRSAQKSQAMVEALALEAEDPAGAVAEALYAYLCDMAGKIRTQRMYRDMMELVLRTPADAAGDSWFSGILCQLQSAWRERGVSCEVDAEGLWSIICAASVLMGSGDRFAEPYFEETLRLLTDAGTRRYIRKLPTGAEKSESNKSDKKEGTDK